MNDPNQLDKAWAKVLQAIAGDIDEILKMTLEEVTTYRNKVDEGHIDDDPHSLHKQVLNTRLCTDRVEELTSFVQRLHTNCQRALNVKKQELEDAEAEAIGSKTTLTGDYSTAKERNAELLLKTTSQRMGVRKAERRLLVLREVLDYCRDCHRGLNDTRRDLDLRVRLITLQSQLEK